MTARRRIALSTTELAANSRRVPPAPVGHASYDPSIPRGMCRVNLSRKVRINGTEYGPGEGVLVPAECASVWSHGLAGLLVILALTLPGVAMAQRQQKVCFETAAGTMSCPTDAMPIRQNPVGTTETYNVGFNGIAATLTQIKAAPSAGYSIYITDIFIQTTTTTSGTFAFQSGTGTNCGTSTTAVFPVSAAANRFNAPITTEGLTHFKLTTAIKLTAAHALCVIGVATNTVSGTVLGYVAP